MWRRRETGKAARETWRPFSFVLADGITLELRFWIESEPKLQILFLTRFLYANRFPLRSKTL
jgi:hypothetical protein